MISIIQKWQGHGKQRKTEKRSMETKETCQLNVMWYHELDPEKEKIYIEK